MTERINYISLIVGRRGSGKTSYLKQLIKGYPKRVLIVDTLDHPAYRGYQIITPDMLYRWKSGVKRIVISDLDEVLRQINDQLTNAMIVFEDATKYFRGNLPKEVIAFIYDSKQKNLDLVFMYHGFKKIVPELLDNANTLTVFKLNENIEKYEYKIPDYSIVQSIAQRVKNDKNPYANLTIKVN